MPRQQSESFFSVYMNLFSLIKNIFDEICIILKFYELTNTNIHQKRNYSKDFLRKKSLFTMRQIATIKEGN